MDESETRCTGGIGERVEADGERRVSQSDKNSAESGTQNSRERTRYAEEPVCRLNPDFVASDLGNQTTFGGTKERRSQYLDMPPAA